MQTGGICNPNLVLNESERTGARAQALAGLPSLATAAARLPPVHVDEDDQRFTITADVPGLAKDDIKVRRVRCSPLGYFLDLS